MTRRRKIWMTVISALLSCLFVYGVYFLQLKQLEFQEMVYVVVPKSFIDAGTLLTRQDVELSPIVKGAYDSRMMTSLEEAVGMETIIPLARNEPIYEWKLDRFRLMPNKTQSTFQIPRDYVRSVASNIRAVDLVHIYISGVGRSQLLFDQPIRVASAKSSANYEMTDPSGSQLVHAARGEYEQLYFARRYAPGTIEQIDLNLTAEQWLEIDRLCKEADVKLVIAYTPSQIVSEAKSF